MKKKLLGAILSAALSISMAMPAFAEIIWTPDKLPAGYTTNEVENKNFDLNSGGAIERSSYTGYVKDIYGNFMKNATFAGGSRTDENGVLIYPDGSSSSFGSEAKYWEYVNSTIGQNIEIESWHQDTSRSLNENGISNYWYGTNKYGSRFSSNWAWLMVSPDGKKDGLKYAYCFNNYGYLYTNTITPDGYMVNEFGQLMIDGKVMTRKGNDVTTWHGFVRFPIGYLVYDLVTSEQHKNDKPNPFFDLY